MFSKIAEADRAAAAAYYKRNGKQSAYGNVALNSMLSATIKLPSDLRACYFCSQNLPHERHMSEKEWKES